MWLMQVGGSEDQPAVGKPTQLWTSHHHRCVLNHCPSRWSSLHTTDGACQKNLTSTAVDDGCTSFGPSTLRNDDVVRTGFSVKRSCSKYSWSHRRKMTNPRWYSCRKDFEQLHPTSTDLDQQLHCELLQNHSSWKRKVAFYLKIARFLPPRRLFAHRSDQSSKVFDGLEAGNPASSGDWFPRWECCMPPWKRQHTKGKLSEKRKGFWQQAKNPCSLLTVHKDSEDQLWNSLDNEYCDVYDYDDSIVVANDSCRKWLGKV